MPETGLILIYVCNDVFMIMKEDQKEKFGARADEYSGTLKVQGCATLEDLKEQKVSFNYCSELVDKYSYQIMERIIQFVKDGYPNYQDYIPV